MILYVNSENDRTGYKEAERSEKLQFILKLTHFWREQCISVSPGVWTAQELQTCSESWQPAQSVCLLCGMNKTSWETKEHSKEKQDNEALRMSFVLAGFWAELNKQSSRGLEMTLEAEERRKETQFHNEVKGPWSCVSGGFGREAN